MDTLTIDGMRDSILAHYDSASESDVATGLAWYTRAEGEMADMAERYGVSRHTAAGVTAAMSPRARWATNLQWAHQLLEAATSGQDSAPAVGLGASRRKAWAIAQGADPESVLAGPKVTAFYANLTGDPTRPTVDVWAARAAGLNPERLTPRRRAAAREAYVQAAALRSVPVRDLQAAVWVAVRGRAE